MHNNRCNQMMSTQNWECVYTYVDTNTVNIHGIAITPDGRKLVSASYEKILVHDLTTSKISNTLLGHTDFILSIDISPDGKFVASGGMDKEVRIWNLKTGELRNIFALRADTIQCVAFSPDGKIIASGGTNKYRNNNLQKKTTTIYLWDFQTGKLIGTLCSHRLRINTIKFTPDGQILVSESNDGTVKVWNLQTQEVIYTLTGETSSINKIAISPDGKQLWVIGFDRIFNWDLYTGELIQKIEENFEFSFPEALFISSYETILISVFFGNIHASNLTTKEKLFSFDFYYPNDTFGWITTLNINKSGEQLFGCASCSQGVLINVWQLSCLKKSIHPEITSFLTTLENQIEQEKFAPENLTDGRKQIFTSIVRRRGQKNFRQKLLNAYNKLCVITECGIEHILEAAHIYPYKGDDTNKTWNGLILRADVHILFDLYLITINPETKKVCLAPELKNTSYSKFEGKEIRLPQNVNLNLFKEALQWHYKQCTWINN